MTGIVFSFCLFLLELCTVPTEGSKNWAVLVAGSNSWWNYRHQADVCHAYHLLRNHGIPAEHIVTMMYDDIADNSRNPFPGQVFNDYQHLDVYHDVQIDYRGDEVTPENFKGVLLGDEKLKSAGKKVLETGPEDNVFVFFSDHGGALVVAFPKGDLYADELNKTLTQMHENNRYRKMVIYVEACYSGSMFEGILSPKMNVYVTTAANAHESSWASFCGDPKIDTCLADDYSYRWIIDSGKHDMDRYTLGKQYDQLEETVKASNVMEYGDLKLRDNKLSEYQANGLKLPGSIQNKALRGMEIKDQRPSSQAHLISLMRTAMNSKSAEQRELAHRRLQRAIQLGNLARETMDEIVLQVEQLASPTARSTSKEEQIKCFRAIFEEYKNKCFTIQQVPEVSQESTKIEELCKGGVDPQLAIRIVQDVCG